MKVAVLIPARYASTRFPAKPLAVIKGKPLLQWVVEGVQKKKSESDIIVATDHPEIFKLAERLNVKAVMTPSDCPTGTDRIYLAYQELKKQNLNYDVLINVQGDEPLFDGKYVDLLIREFIENPNYQMLTFGHPLRQDEIENRNAVKVVLNQYSEGIYFSRYAIPFSRVDFLSLKNPSSVVLKHVGVYAYRSAFLEKFCQTPMTDLENCESLEQLRALYLGEKIKVLQIQQSLQGVDTPEDIQKVESYL